MTDERDEGTEREDDRSTDAPAAGEGSTGEGEETGEEPTGEGQMAGEETVGEGESVGAGEPAGEETVGEETAGGSGTVGEGPEEGEAAGQEGDGTAEVDAEQGAASGDDEAERESEADAGGAAEGAGTAGAAEDAAATAGDDDSEQGADGGQDGGESVPRDVRKYARFKKMDGAQYERANEFLRDRTYITAREWAIARLCADFRTETGVEMTKIGEHLPELVPFMEDTYTPQAVNQARASFEEKVRKAGATFLYGAMCDFFTPAELDDLMYEVTEVAKFLLEVEGVDLGVEAEMEAEDRISEVMREVREASEGLRYEQCPNCGHDLRQ